MTCGNGRAGCCSANTMLQDDDKQHSQLRSAATHCPGQPDAGPLAAFRTHGAFPTHCSQCHDVFNPFQAPMLTHDRQVQPDRACTRLILRVIMAITEARLTQAPWTRLACCSNLAVWQWSSGSVPLCPHRPCHLHSLHTLTAWQFNRQAGIPICLLSSKMQASR